MHRLHQGWASSKHFRAFFSHGTKTLLKGKKYISALLVFSCTLVIHVASQTTKIWRKPVPPSLKHVIFIVNIKSPYSKIILIKKRKNKGPHSIFCFTSTRWYIFADYILLSLYYIVFPVFSVLDCLKWCSQGNGADWGLCYVKFSPFVSTSSFPFVHFYNEICSSS